jgi:uncharacterized RDD family membrane protein YckC
MRSTDLGREAEESGTPPVVVWSQFAQDAAMTLWPSFLAASVATMFFFAFIDPSLFGDGATPPDWLADHRMAGYAVGFFFFWAICTLSSALTLYLVRTARQQGGSRGPGERTRKQP